MPTKSIQGRTTQFIGAKFIPDGKFLTRPMQKIHPIDVVKSPGVVEKKAAAASVRSEQR